MRARPSARATTCAAPGRIGGAIGGVRHGAAGLAKFWKDGKRLLDINEIADLNADDKDT